MLVICKLGYSLLDPHMEEEKRSSLKLKLLLVAVIPEGLIWQIWIGHLKPETRQSKWRQDGADHCMFPEVVTGENTEDELSAW